MCESTCSVLLVTIPLVSPFSQDQMVDSMFTMWIYNHESRRQYDADVDNDDDHAYYKGPPGELFESSSRSYGRKIYSIYMPGSSTRFGEILKRNDGFTVYHSPDLSAYSTRMLGFETGTLLDPNALRYHMSLFIYATVYHNRDNTSTHQSFARVLEERHTSRDPSNVLNQLGSNSGFTLVESLRLEEVTRERTLFCLFVHLSMSRFRSQPSMMFTSRLNRKEAFANTIIISSVIFRSRDRRIEVKSVALIIDCRLTP
ncbi:hypothetical protein ABKN59_009671 [Abortiporus biennis]